MRGLLAALFLALAGLVPAAAAEPMAVEQVFRKDQSGGVAISPSGRFVAVLAPWKDRRNVAILDLETRKSSMATALEDADVLAVRWLNDTRLYVTYGDLQLESGVPPRESGIVAFDRDGTNLRHLARGSARPFTTTFLRAVAGTDDVLVSSRDRSAQHLDVHRVNTRTGERTLLTFDPPGPAAAWIFGWGYEPRVVATTGEGAGWHVRMGSGWRRLDVKEAVRRDGVLLGLSPDEKHLYVRTRGTGDRYTIEEVDLATGQLGEQPVLAHPERDITGNFRMDLAARKVLGYFYIDDQPSVVWFDAEHARVQKSVDAVLKETVNVVAKAAEGSRWIVASGSDRHPGTVYLLDGATMRLEKLLDVAPWFDPAKMASTRWVRYTARDGLEIPALLTVPPGKAGQRVPLIVHIHGGPNVFANTWGFDRIAQFFASRGYATLVPQFRGTNGFGRRHFEAGFRQWGQAMQHDLADGVRWAVAEGIADRDRVCYFGASYGGYAAMWGAIQDKALLKCAVAYLGVSSIDGLFNSNQTDLAHLREASGLVRERVGDPAKDREMFRRYSPLEHAADVGVPILLAYGTNDRIVPIAHGLDFRAALQKHGKPHEWVAYDGEAHGFRKTENVVDFYRRVERFLAEHLR